MENIKNMKELIINGKLFHFVQYAPKNPNWDTTFELTVNKVIQTIKNTKKDNDKSFGYVRYYGIGGFGGLVSKEPCSIIDDSYFDLDEQLEAAKLGCDIIYEYSI